jgi:hypothetical protein
MSSTFSIASSSSFMLQIMVPGAAVKIAVDIALKIRIWWYVGIWSVAVGVFSGLIFNSSPYLRFGKFFGISRDHCMFGVNFSITKGIPFFMISAKPLSSYSISVVVVVVCSVMSLMVAAVSCVIIVGLLVGVAAVLLSDVWFVADNSFDLYVVSGSSLLSFDVLPPPPRPCPPPPLPPPVPFEGCIDVAVGVPARSLPILTLIAAAV